MNSRPLSHSPSRFLFSRDPHCRIFLSPDDGAENPGGDNNNPVVPPVENHKPPKTDAEYRALAQALVAEVMASKKAQDSPEEALKILAGRTARLKDDYDAKVEEVGVLKSQIPDSTQSKADATELAAWRALEAKGIKKPDDVNTIIGERDNLRGTTQKHEKEKAISDVADIRKLKNNALLRSLLGNAELVIEGAIEGDEDKRVVKVKTKTEKDGKTEEAVLSFDDYVKTRPELQEALPALQREESQQQGGSRHVAQGSGGTSSAGSKYEKIRDENKKAGEAKKGEAPQPLESIMNIGTNSGTLP